MFYRRDLQRILSQCDEAEEIAKEHAVEFIKVNLVHQARGCALCLCDAKAGYELLTQQTDFWTGIGGAVNVPMGNMHRSIALSELGSMEKALDIIDRAISDCHAKGEQWIAPEALRTRGELLLVGEFDVQGAEAAFQEAIALAREHAAKSWELRAATSLARLRQSQGEIREGHQLLAPVYEWFSEGFDTPDLKEAKALLEELS
jgi:predicted ATPase